MVGTGFVAQTIDSLGYFQLTLDVLLLLFAAWIVYKTNKKHPSNTDLKKRIDDMEVQVAESRMKIKTALTEIYDYVDGTLTPLHKRLVTRARRQKEYDEKEDEETGKGKHADPFDDIRKLSGKGGGIGIS